MKPPLFCYILLILLSQRVTANFYFNIFSPDNQLQLNFQLSREGIPYYTLNMGSKAIIKKGLLGIKVKDGFSFDDGFQIKQIDTVLVNTSWKPVWGETREITNHYKSMVVTLTQAKALQREFKIEFRLYNDGMGFRYHFPGQEVLANFIVTDELTTFPLSGDHKCFWIPGDYDSNEYLYSTTTLTQIRALNEIKGDGIGFKSLVHDSCVQTPFTMKSKEGYYLAIHEAALLNYPAMNLDVYRNQYLLKAHLVPDAVGNKAYLRGGSHTPWRVIILVKKAADLLTSKIILNLNDAPADNSVDFIKPGKFMGIWWEMHIGKRTWDYTGKTGQEIPLDQMKPSGKHGATTENAIRYIDFASKHGIPYLLIEGWNTGWEDWHGAWKETVFSFNTPYPDFDIDKISAYAKSKNVKLIMHHETSSAVTDYERQIDEAFRYLKKYEYAGLKSGYVGRIIPRGEHHDGQWMINHYQRVAEKCLENKIILDVHEPVRPTGLHRRYPHWMACEAARGNEFNAWSTGNPPEHETILPFTRLLGGPMDYTPGIFQIKMNAYDTSKIQQVHSTLCKQLALYVTLYSPLQMAADLPENYERFPDAFQFIKDVPVDWDSTIVIEAEPGDYLSLARKEKNTNDWYIGAITDEQSRDVQFNLEFLDAGKKYEATMYMDGLTADWLQQPMLYKIEKKKVKKSDKLKIHLAPGGGCAISIKETKS